MKVWYLAKKELRSYLLSPLAWVLLAVYFALGGYFFSGAIIITGRADMTGYFANMAIILLFIVPALTMRLWAEEEARGTSRFLLTAPLTVAEIITAKFLAALALMLLAELASLVYVLILSRLGSPDLGTIFASYLGFTLLMAACIAVGVFASSISSSQMVAGLTAFGLLLLLWVVDWVSSSVPAGLGSVLKALSFPAHLIDFLKGMVGTDHIVFYLSAVLFFLFLAVESIAKKTWA
jgi:ABC-2 type transport system permease protein